MSSPALVAIVVGRHDCAPLHLERLAARPREGVRRARRRARSSSPPSASRRGAGTGSSGTTSDRECSGSPRPEAQRRLPVSRCPDAPTRSCASRSCAGFPASASGSASICLSLFLLGLIDNAALDAARGRQRGSRRAERLGAARVDRRRRRRRARRRVRLVPAAARASPPARALQVRLAGSREHAAPQREAANAWMLVVVSWVLARRSRSSSCSTRSRVGTSMPLAMGFLCASASAAALPIAPAGGVAQAGAGAAILVCRGRACLGGGRVRDRRAGDDRARRRGRDRADDRRCTSPGRAARASPRGRPPRLLEAQLGPPRLACARRAVAHGRARRRRELDAPPPSSVATGPAETSSPSNSSSHSASVRDASAASSSGRRGSHWRPDELRQLDELAEPLPELRLERGDRQEAAVGGRVDAIAGDAAGEQLRHRLAADAVRDEVVRAVRHRDRDAARLRPRAARRGSA